jgi:hypothetical protein
MCDHYQYCSYGGPQHFYQAPSICNNHHDPLSEYQLKFPDGTTVEIEHKPMPSMGTGSNDSGLECCCFCCSFIIIIIASALYAWSSVVLKDQGDNFVAVGMKRFAIVLYVIAGILIVGTFIHMIWVGRDDLPCIKQNWSWRKSVADDITKPLMPNVDDENVLQNV